jgi:hypothetical protein
MGCRAAGGRAGAAGASAAEGTAGAVWIWMGARRAVDEVEERGMTATRDSVGAK